MYPSTLAVPCLLLVALVVIYRPRLLGRGPTRSLDLWLLLALGAAALQMVPLPRPVVDLVSPATTRAAMELSLRDTGGARPLSINLTDSATAVALFGGMVFVFFTARQIFDAGGVRTVARGTAIIGLVLAGVAIAQDATGAGLMYWRWRPTFQRTDPFGPFVNRNHSGTWAIMAIPLVIGYLIVHATARRHAEPGVSWRTRVVAALDGRAALLLSSGALMIVAVVLSLSRSAILGLVAAFVFGGWLSHRRSPSSGGARSRPALVAGVLTVVAAALIIIRVPPGHVVDRASGAAIALEGRATIWRETLPVVRDFWLAGTGVGAYQTAMAIYQRSNIGLIYNQAHNHYLQVAAEGGLLVGIPVAIALMLFVRAGSRAVARDESGMFWLRVGAASGLAGVAVQCLFETGLLTPANSVLAAIVAAVLLHVPTRSTFLRLE